MKNNNRSNYQTLHVQHTFFCTFLCRCFARLQRETFRNFLVTRFMQGCRTFYRSFCFSLPLIFTFHWWPLAFLIFSPPLQNFHGVFPTKIVYLVFSSRRRSLLSFFLDELRWPAAYFLFFSVFLFLYIPNLRA